MAPTLLATFAIVVVLLSVYEFGLSDRFERFGRFESFLSIAISAIVALVPTYLALRKLRKSHGRALSALTELKAAEAESKESDRRFRNMLENVGLIAVTLDNKGVVTFCNNHLLRLTGWEREEVNGRDYFSIFVPGSNSARKEVFLENVKTGTIAPHLENQITTKYGEIREIVWSNTMLQDQGGNIVGTASIGDDVTARYRAEKRLQLQQSVTAVLAEAMPLDETYLKVLEKLCVGLKFDYGAIWIIDGAPRLLRCAEVWHSPSTELRDFAAENRRITLARGQDLPGRIWANGRAGWCTDIEKDPGCERRVAVDLGLHGWIGFPIGLSKQILGVAEFFSVRLQSPDAEKLTTLSDIGMQVGQFIERRQLEEQYRQAQKMEALGTLSGGIAHDFNNIIGAIVGYTELAKMALKDNSEDSEVAEHLDEVLLGANRAADLVRQILAFSRQHEQERRPIQLQHIVAEALKLLRATIPAPIEFIVSLDKDVPTVLADATQVHQVVMNLGTNASHAMKDSLGRLTVALENYEVAPDGVELHPGLKPGRYARLSMSDTGHGMDQGMMSRIFEPFFTTKAPGEGTGLGLAVVQGIMQSHDGAVTVYSHVGDGTTFHLYFPVSGIEESNAEIATETAPMGKGEAILYVDDELALAKMGEKILEHLGYTVDIHTNAVEALDAVRAKPGAYSLIITDQMMPRLTGIEFAKQIRAFSPHLPIILMTGHTATLTPDRVRAMGIQDLLLKPISVASLGTAVQRVLSHAKSH
jgi:PAS domain S-box-containing protein